MICKHCGKEFNAKHKLEKYCSQQCFNNAKYLRKVIRRSENLKNNFIENDDYVIDRWNGYAVICMYGLYFKAMHPDKTLDDYKTEFPNALLCSKKHSKETSKNSGQFMKTDEYRKKYSEMLKGENNPNHRSRTTERERKERSPFSKEFYKKHDGDRDVFIKNVGGHRSYNTQIEYYLRQGMSEKEAKAALSERQRTFTLEKCIERHGEEEGRRIFEERQIKWSKKMDDLYQAGAYSKFPKNLSLNGTSQVERMFIDKIIRQFNLPENYVFCYRTNQLSLYDKENCCWYFYDFAYKNKIIEVNGDYWHMNPERFGPDDENYMTGRTASETWSYDARKKETACTAGYEVLHIWERDIRHGESDVFKNIKIFLNDENNKTV